MSLAIIFDSVGVGEWFVLLAVILIVVGPKRLPSTARKFGSYYSKFRRAADNFKRQLMDMDTEINNAVSEAERVADDAASLPEDSAEVASTAEDVPMPDVASAPDSAPESAPDSAVEAEMTVPEGPVGPDGESETDYYHGD